MSETTGIEWTDSTWNPLRGCTRVSEGCRNCYAERVAYRFSGAGQPYEGLAVLKNGHASWTGKVSLAEKHLLDPLRWKKPQRIFVNSMSDLFHESVPDEWIDRIFAVMALCPHHIFQVLTKRPARMLRYLTHDLAPLRWADSPADWELSNADDRCVFAAMEKRDSAKLDSKGCVHLDNPLPNVWLGVSCENQVTADERIPLLLQTPAAVRFISAEPLLGAIDMALVKRPDEFHRSPYGWHHWWPKKLHWVIVGGESGPGARPMDPAWARSLRDQCQSAGVPFFMKQMGSVYGPNKGHKLPPDLDIREFPQ